MSAGMCHCCGTVVCFIKEDYIKVVMQNKKTYHFHSECFWKSLRPSILTFEDDLVTNLLGERNAPQVSVTTRSSAPLLPHGNGTPGSSSHNP